MIILLTLEQDMPWWEGEYPPHGQGQMVVPGLIQLHLKEKGRKCTPLTPLRISTYLMEEKPGVPVVVKGLMVPGI